MALHDGEALLVKYGSAVVVLRDGTEKKVTAVSEIRFTAAGDW